MNNDNFSAKNKYAGETPPPVESPSSLVDDALAFLTDIILAGKQIMTATALVRK